jgi:hypothetical protein
MARKKDLFNINSEAAAARFGELSNSSSDEVSTMKTTKRKQDAKTPEISTAVRSIWPNHLSSRQAEQLDELVRQFGFSVVNGDLQLLSGHWYVTHSGLLRLARKNHCSGIQTEMVSEFCDPSLSRWVVKATVYKTARSKGFVGYGDADPSNVSALVRGAEMRVAETRAVNRALRKAYGIGLCSVEEIGNSDDPLPPPTMANKEVAAPEPANGHLLRDRLCLLIRQHRLDANQVKRYATAFCGTETLRQASREQVEQFVDHLTQLARQGGDELLAQLAPYAQPEPAKTDKEAA